MFPTRETGNTHARGALVVEVVTTDEARIGGRIALDADRGVSLGAGSPLWTSTWSGWDLVPPGSLVTNGSTTRSSAPLCANNTHEPLPVCMEWVWVADAVPTPNTPIMLIVPATARRRMGRLVGVGAQAAATGCVSRSAPPTMDTTVKVPYLGADGSLVA